MNKQEIFEKLNDLHLDKEKYIIISGASLVVQDIINETLDIDLATSKEYYNSLHWPIQKGSFGVDIKKFDCFKISFNLYQKHRFVIINGYKFALLEDILTVKKQLNRTKDQEIISKLNNILNKKNTH